MKTEADRHDEMPAEIDLSEGTRGKFAKPAATLLLPVYLNPAVRIHLAIRATPAASTSTNW